MRTKSSFLGFKFIYKMLQTFPSDLKTDQKYFKQGKLLKVIFEIPIFFLMFHMSRAHRKQLSVLQTYDVFLKYYYPGLCGIKICAL